MRPATEGAPTGLDVTTLVSLASETAAVAVCRVRGTPTTSPALAAPRLADYQFGNMQGGTLAPTAFEYRIGTRSTHVFSIVVRGNARHELRFEDAPDFAADWVSFDRLPAAFRDSLTARLAEMRGMRNRGAPPPLGL